MCLSAVSEVEPYASKGATYGSWGGARRETGPYPLDDQRLVIGRANWAGSVVGFSGSAHEPVVHDRYSVRNLIR